MDSIADQIKRVDFVHVMREANFFADAIAKMEVDRVNLFCAWF